MSSRINISFFLLLLSITASFAGEMSRDTLVIATSEFPPLVIKDSSGFSGFDIELWQAIAEDLEVQYVWREVNFKDILVELDAGRIDAAIAGISINAEREHSVDFSQHYLDSGLQIMVPASSKTDLSQTLERFFTPNLLRGVVVLILFIFLCGQILWWSERGKDAINDRYFPGIFEAFWCVVTTMTTVGYGDIAPRRWLGRAAAFLVMITGIALFGWIIGEFAAATTLQSLETSIAGPDDLRGKRVATVEATTSVGTLKEFGARVIEVKHPKEAYRMLLSDEIDAVVYDSPVLLNYANNEGAGKVAIVGGVFDKQYYGIAFPEGSLLREDVNRALLKLRERKHGVSIYTGIYRKWFGDL